MHSLLNSSSSKLMDAPARAAFCSHAPHDMGTGRLTGGRQRQASNDHAWRSFSELPRRACAPARAAAFSPATVRHGRVSSSRLIWLWRHRSSLRMNWVAMALAWRLVMIEGRWEGFGMAHLHSGMLCYGCCASAGSLGPRGSQRRRILCRFVPI